MLHHYVSLSLSDNFFLDQLLQTCLAPYAFFLFLIILCPNQFRFYHLYEFLVAIRTYISEPVELISITTTICKLFFFTFAFYSSLNLFTELGGESRSFSCHLKPLLRLSSVDLLYVSNFLHHKNL